LDAPPPLLVYYLVVAAITAEEKVASTPTTLSADMQEFAAVVKVLVPNAGTW